MWKVLFSTFEAFFPHFFKLTDGEF